MTSNNLGSIESGGIDDEPNIPAYSDTGDGTEDTPTNAGTGSPTQSTIRITTTSEPIRPIITETVTVPAPAPSPPVPSPSPNPKPPSPNPDTEEKTCYSLPNREVLGSTVQDALDGFCEYADGEIIKENNFLQVKAPGDFLSNVMVSVTGKNKCEFKIEEDECKRILNKVVGCTKTPLLRIGGEVESNCATWVLDPIENLQGECIPIPGLATWCRLIQFFAG